MVALAAILPPFAILPWKRGSLGRAMQPLWGVLALVGGARRAGLGAADRALDAGAGRRRARRLAGARRRSPRSPAGSRLGRAAAAETLRRRAQPAARRLGQGARACRARRHDLRHRRDHRLGDRGHPRGPPRRDASRSPATSCASTASSDARGPNYGAETATVTVLPRRPRGRRRCTPRSGSTTCRGCRPPRRRSTAACTRDLYVALGDAAGGGGWALRTYVKPFANWIWVGAMIMAVGGVVSLTDRRYRVGAPARRAPPAAAVPAE